MLAVNGVYCMDALELLATFPNQSVDLVLTDVPYAALEGMPSGIRELNKGFANTLNFDLGEFVKECVRVTKGGVYIFCGIEQMSSMFMWMDESLWTRHCIWEKTNPSPHNGEFMWMSSFENCVYGKRPKATFNEFCHSAVWRFPSGTSKRHPTEKSIQLFEYLIATSSNIGDLVIDPCVGSGTTAQAARALHRSYIVGDVNPDCVSMSLDRLRLPFEPRSVHADAALDDLPLFQFKPEDTP